MSKQYLTKEKYNMLVEEIAKLKTGGKKEIAERLRQAKALGDLSENADYQEAREQQSTLERRIHELEEVLRNSEIIEKNNCTWFIPRVSKLDARKKWIIGSVSPKGALIIDNGAIQAIKNGKSLLPVGIKAIDGKFEKGDHIKVLDLNNKEYARGLSSFSSDEINKIKGSQSNQIKKILGYSSKDEVIHKDDLVKV